MAAASNRITWLWLPAAILKLPKPTNSNQIYIQTIHRPTAENRRYNYPPYDCGWKPQPRYAVGSRSHVLLLPNRMWIKTKRRQHAHGDARGKRKDGRTKMELDHVAKFYQHHQKGQQHHIHHAPLSKVLHHSQRKGFVFSMKQLQPTELQQKQDFGQWKYNRKQKYDPANKPTSMLKQFNCSAKDAALMGQPQLINSQNRKQNRWPEQNKGADRSCCSTACRNVAAGRFGKMASATRASRSLFDLKSWNFVDQATAMAGFEHVLNAEVGVRIGEYRLSYVP